MMKRVLLMMIILTVGALCVPAVVNPVAAGSDDGLQAVYSIELPGLTPGASGTPPGGDKGGPQFTVTPVAPTPTPIPPTPVPPTPVPPTPTPVVNPGVGSYAQAKAFYEAGGVAWTNAWGASDFAVIRQYLVEAKTAYTNCLNTANTVNDPANAANLALLKSISTAYIGLADAALAMYDGSDVYGAGRGQMVAGDLAGAAVSFQSAATKFDSSKTLFAQATTTLQSVVYAGTEYGDGTAYTAVIVPILNAKGAYMGEFSTYAQGWQHTALAYQANAVGDPATFRSEAQQAMTLFDALRNSEAFGADAISNYNILAPMVEGAGQVTPTVTVTLPGGFPSFPVTTTATPTTVATTKTKTPTPTPTKTPTKTPTPTPTKTKTPTPTATPTSHYSGWTVPFTPAEMGATSGNQIAWYWTFGDGGTSTLKNPSHTYTREGWWTVTLKVTYSDHSTRTFSIHNYIHTYYT